MFPPHEQNFIPAEDMQIPRASLTQYLQPQVHAASRSLLSKITLTAWQGLVV